MSEKINILVIDDDESIRDSCSQVFKKDGNTVKTAKDGTEGLNLFKKEFFHVVLLDLKMPGLTGMQVLTKIKEEHPETPVIIITGYATIESAVEAIKRGAYDYLAKPFTPEQLRVVTNKALENRKILFENIYLRDALKKKTEFDRIIGKSKAMKKVLDIVKRVCSSESTILITGESGTGKELFAREIHDHSPRKNAPFVVVDCGALVETLFESELFGHVKGSFTGAYETKHGRFEVANGGTIFLDEISNISLNIQANLLRVIQEREITRVGSTKPIKVNVRVLAATNENLADLVKNGKFREDLFYRLSVVPINLPPLRERKEDIPLLLEHFLQKYNRITRKKINKISSEVKKALMEYDWPGNIRELENTIERAVVLSKGDEIELEDLMYHGISSTPSLFHMVRGKYQTLDDIEKEYIKEILLNHQGNKSKTAKILGIDRKTLWAKIKKYKIQ
ncbi:MAG: sigma-54-dependent Fis family transcriptional regulator [Candidatus Aminicenantes bacterium]|nr:MAG: sigma-54-dependent Fis family transcriptional regulator [Candidatus Aminicenantes bacterium]